MNGPAPRGARPAWATEALVVAAYAVLAVAMTWPTGTDPARLLLGGLGDTLLPVWNFVRAWEALVVHHASPFFFPLAYLPYPAQWLHNAHSTGYGLLYCAVAPLLGHNPVLWMNLCIWGSFTLAAWGMFRLARELTGSTGGALLAGVIFAFCSQRLIRAVGHLNVLSGEWVPWYAWFLFRALRHNRPRQWLGCALCLSASLWNEYYHALFCLLFTALTLGVPSGARLWGAHGLRARLRALRPAVLAGAVLCAPFAWGVARTIQTGEIVVGDGYDRFRLTLLNYLLPSGFHVFWRRWLEDLYLLEALPGGASEATAYVGYGALVLAGWALLRVRPKPPELRVLAWGVGVFFLFSLGSGRVLLPPEETGFTLWLPYDGLRLLPFCGDFRSPARFCILVMLCLAPLAAWGYALLAARLRRAGARRGLLAGLACLALVEHLHAPWWFHFNAALPREQSSAILETIRRDPLPGAVMNLPLRHEEFPGLWFQIFHHRPMLSGIVGRFAPSQVEYFDGLDTRSWFAPDARFARPADDPLAPLGVRRAPERFAQWAPEPDPWTPEAIARLCYFFDLRCILIPWPVPGTDVVGRFRAERFPLEQTLRDGEAWLGLVRKQAAPPWPRVLRADAAADQIYFTRNFSPPEAGFRWIEARKAVVTFRLDAPETLALTLSLGYPPHLPPKAQRLRLVLAGQVLHDAELAPGWSDVACRVPAAATQAGYNHLELHAAEARPPNGFERRKLALKLAQVVLDQQK